MRQPKCECGECKYCKKRSEYLRHRDRYIERSTEYQKVNRLQTNEKNARWKSRNPDKLKSQWARRNHRLSGTPQQQYRQRCQDLKKYKVTPEWFDAKLAEQGGGCAICGRKVESNGRRLHLDHDHETDSNRGILCHQCNTCLPVIENDPEWATKALAYIQKYKDEWWAEMTLKFSRKV